MRNYIALKGYEVILVPLYDKAEVIDFDALPNKFVLKTINGSQTNILCEEKQALKKEDTVKVISNWLMKRSSKLGREWSGNNIEPFCLYVIEVRLLENGIKFWIYDANFKIKYYTRLDSEVSNSNAIKP